MIPSKQWQGNQRGIVQEFQSGRVGVDAKTKTLIGAQVISEEIVSGTVDKLAVAIACKIPIMRLVQIDSSYSPYVQEDQIAVPLHRLIDKLG